MTKTYTAEQSANHAKAAQGILKAMPQGSSPKEMADKIVRTLKRPCFTRDVNERIAIRLMMGCETRLANPELVEDLHEELDALDKSIRRRLGEARARQVSEHSQNLRATHTRIVRENPYGEIGNRDPSVAKQ
ncbi:MAG: hypothetical protein WAX89_03415 [Alphaproteobacteria bacterium]